MTKSKLLCGMVDCDNEAGPWTQIEMCVWCLQRAQWAIEEWPAQQIKRRAREEQRGSIYMVQVGERIKVGFSTRVRQRLRQYPPGSVLLVDVYGPEIRLAQERALHERLAQYRVAGREWYRDCEGVRAVVDELVQQYGKPTWQVQWGSGQSRRREGAGTTRRAAVILDRR